MSAEHAEALVDRLLVPHRDEQVVGYMPVPTRARVWDACSRCSRRADDLLDRAHGERICGACRELERVRYEAATGDCVHGCGYALAFHHQPRSLGDDCPTEAEARAMAGDR